MKKRKLGFIKILMALFVFLNASFGGLVALAAGEPSTFSSALSDYVVFSVDEDDIEADISEDLIILKLLPSVIDKEIEIFFQDEDNSILDNALSLGYQVEHQVATLTKEKYEELQELENAYILAVEEEDNEAQENAILDLAEGILLECDDLVEGEPIINEADLNWVDCEQMSYILVYTVITDLEDNEYQGYILQHMQNPQVCEEVPAPVPAPEPNPSNPKTGLSSPIALSIATITAGVILLKIRKKSYI